MPNILDSYLVKLGAAVDSTSWNKFNVTLQTSQNSVLSFASTTIGQFAKVEASIVGTLATSGLAMIALADKTAMADQQYRLFGMRMLMTKESARAMSMAQDELGASLDEIAYDPELNKRFQYLYEQNMKLGKSMGSGFDNNMRLIRDLRMEYGRFTTELQFLEGGVVSQLFEKLGFGSGDVTNQLHKLNDWFTDNLPKFRDEISTDIIPVWQDWVVVAKDLGGIIKMAASEWVFFTSLLTGDDSLKDSEVNIRNITKASMDWLDVLTEIALGLQVVMKTALHATAAIGASLGSYKAFWSGNFKESERLGKIADVEGKNAYQDFQDFVGGYGTINKNKDFAGIREFFNLRDAREKDSQLKEPDIAKFITDSATKYHIDPNLLSAVIKQESGYKSGVISPKGAIGMMQIMPDTAKELGLDNPFDPEKNIDAGANYLHQLIKRYHGNVPEALGAYNAGIGNTDKYGGIPPFKETQDYVSSILGNWEKMSQKSADAGGGVTIESIVVNVPHALPDDQWSDFVRRSVGDIVDTKTKNTTAQVGAGAYQ